MGLITKMRRQAAIYWPPATLDDFGKESYSTLVELVLDGGDNYRVRWEAVNEEYLDAQSTIRRSNATVYCPILPGGGEVEVGGYLWLGARGGLTDEANPTNNDGAYEVRRFDKTPNLKASEFLRVAYL